MADELIPKVGSKKSKRGGPRPNSGRKKGTPRSPGTGRKKGTPNKKSLVLRERLEHFGCDFDEQLAKAILDGKVYLIKALLEIIPYIQPKFKEIDYKKPEDDMSGGTEKLTEESIKKLVAAAM